jgi:hypothetical protein
MSLRYMSSNSIKNGLRSLKSLISYVIPRHTITRSGTAITTSTTQVKFGTTSAATTVSSGSYLTVTPSTDFAFGTADFTVEFWYYPTSLAGQQTFFGTRPAGTNGNYFMMGLLSGNFYVYSNAYIINVAHGLVTNQWQHIAISRASGTVRYFVDGVQKSSASYGTTLIASRLVLFTDDFATVGQFQPVGFIDEMRVSNSARYTAAFTPAASAFDTDANTLMLLHFDGVNGGTSFTDSVLS